MLWQPSKNKGESERGKKETAGTTGIHHEASGRGAMRLADARVPAYQGWQEFELAYCEQKPSRTPAPAAGFYVHPIGAGRWCVACETNHHDHPQPRLREERQLIETRHGVFGL